MLPETLVLNSHKGIYHLLRNLIVILIDTIGIDCRQGIDLFSVLIVNDGLKALRLDTDAIDVGRIVKHTLQHTETGSCHHKDQENDQRKQKLHTADQNAALISLPLGNQSILFSL